MRRLLTFRVAKPTLPTEPTVFLEHNTWDDYGHRTLYRVIYVVPDGLGREIGSVKVGQFGLPEPRRGYPVSSSPPPRFQGLDSDTYFSLGQDTGYYENLNAIDAAEPGFRESYLSAMNDIADNPTLLQRALDERVTKISLLRTVTVATIRNQFARVIHGGQTRERYDLKFPVRDGPGSTDLQIIVDPGALLPENLRVLIGRNGAGKSRTLYQINQMLIKGSTHHEPAMQRQRAQLANLVWVSFSAFDPLYPIPNDAGRDGLVHHYVGLKRTPKTRPSNESDLLSPHDLGNGAIDATWNCASVEGLRQRLIAFLTRLDAGDPNFEATGLSSIVAESNPMDDIPLELMQVVADLSSGHKIALLTASRLVETVAEKTLVLIDEPEVHLHPPLLSALMRAISDLLADRNGIAIVATHSPVVLQEVPRSCVFVVDTDSRGIVLTPPDLETFGENVGTLTREIFGYEVQHTGFVALLREITESAVDYDHAMEMLRGQLGAEGRAVLRTMMATKATRSRDVGS